MNSFDVRKSAVGYVVDFDDAYVVADDDPQRALRSMDTFIGGAIAARQKLRELIADDES